MFVSFDTITTSYLLVYRQEKTTCMYIARKLSEWLQVGLRTFFWKGLDSKYFQLCGPSGLYHNCPSLPLVALKQP